MLSEKKFENNFQKIISQSRDWSNSNRQFRYNNKSCSKKTQACPHAVLPDFLTFQQPCSYQNCQLTLEPSKKSKSGKACVYKFARDLRGYADFGS